MAQDERRHYWIEVLAGPIATLIGILVAGAGVVYTVDANNDTERARLAAAAAAQQEERRTSFELAAAQIVMSQENCTLARARARELVQLFPTRLQSPEFNRLARPSQQVCAALRRTRRFPANPFPVGPSGQLPTG